jgi:hypothetical protein
VGFPNAPTASRVVKSRDPFLFGEPCCDRPSTVAVGAEQTDTAKSTSEEAKPNRIKIEYVPPTNPQHEEVYRHLKETQALEKVQAIFSPFRLPIDLTVKTVGCDGQSNAWYLRPTLTLCYEYLDAILRNAPKEVTASGVTPVDAVVGQFYYVVSHEMGHAMFDLLDVPFFGHAEDVADEFSTFMMVHLGKDQATRLISGAAYSYKNAVQNPAVIMPLQAFSDVHGTPAQRFYNMLCLAYGADPKTFSRVAEDKYLPQTRAPDCQREWYQVAASFKRYILPHMDLALAKQVLDKDWLPPESKESLQDYMNP